MQLQHLTYGADVGWSQPPAGDLDGPQTLVLVFAAPAFSADSTPFDSLAAAFPRAIMLGCSTSGEIAGKQVHDASVSVAVAKFEHTQLRFAATASADATDTFDAGARLAAQLTGSELRSVFILSDGLSVNGTALVDGLARHLQPGVIITGGLAGDGSRFQETWILDRGKPTKNHVCAVGFYGSRLHVGHGCNGGWQDFGPERRITRSAGNVLYELDDKPALELYKTYLGKRAEGLPGTALLFPLAIRPDGDGHNALVRTILGVDEAQHSLTFAGDIPQGGIARLMRANAEQLIDSAAIATQQAFSGSPRDDDATAAALIISVSCVGRRLVLGERIEEEVEAVLDGAPHGAVHVGFYSYGEIAPWGPGGVGVLHNQTMTITVLSEA